jgi:hypothetical protein
VATAPNFSAAADRRFGYRLAAFAIPPMDPDAFHTLAMTELDAVYRFAWHLARRREEAEDLVQETYLRALTS